MNNKRKSRSNTTRSSRTRPDRSVTADGIYQNAHFMHAITSHVGNTVQVQTLNGSLFEGVFRTFSSSFEVVLEMAHKVDQANPAKISVDTVVEKLIFKPQDIITIEARDVDLEYATRDTFKTDTAISKFNGQVPEKKLEPWIGPGCNGDDGYELESANANGWNVEEMFRKNEQVYGVQSSFQPSLEGYTLQLQKKDTKDYKEAEAKAAKIASEIEANPNYKARIDVENGDEEDAFAAVVRPSEIQGAGLAAGSGSSIEGGKYVPPAKRKNPQTGKLVRSTPPPSSQPQQQATSPQQAQSQQPQQQPVPQIPQQQPQQQAPPPARTGGGTYLHPPPFQPSSGVVTPVVSLNQPPPVSHVHGAGYAPVPPQQQPPLPQREPNKISVMDSKRPLQQIRPGPRGAFPVSEAPRYPLDQSQQGPLPPRVDPKLSHHAPGGLPPAPFPSSGNTAPSSAPTQVLTAPAPVVAGTPSLTSPTLVATPAVVSVQQPPPAVDSMTAMKVASPPEQAQMVQQVPNTNTNNAPVNRKLPQSSRGRDEQQAELKKFGQDFKLSTGETGDTSANDCKKQGQVQSPEEGGGNKDQQSGELGGGPVDKVASALKKSTLNPNAKEFVYNPNAKPFTPRSPSTPTPSRPHTPQTPQYCGAPPGAAAGMAATAMVMPTYVVAATNQPTAFTPQNQNNRFRKVPLPMPHRPDIASQMQVAAATGQPLLAPAPIPAQFALPYPHQGHLPPQTQYQHVVRMVQQGAGMVPIGTVPTSMSYHHESPGPQPPPGPHQLQYMSPAPPAAMGPPHHAHPHHHPHHHGHPPPPSQQGPPPGGPSPAQGATPNPPGPPHTPVGAPNNANAAGGGAYHHHPQGGHPQSPAGAPPATYQQPPPGPPQGHPPSGPHTYSIMCPVLPPGQLAPGPHTPHHPMMQPASMQQAAVQYIHHQHQVGSTQPHIQVILPHNQ